VREAHDAVSRFRRDLREAEKGSNTPTYLINCAGTLVADIERLGADEMLVDVGKQLASEAMTLLKRHNGW
jgi:hypothetical protein